MGRGCGDGGRVAFGRGQAGAHRPPFAEDPLGWGDPPHVRSLFGGLDLRFERASYTERFASLDQAVELYTTTNGPVVALGGPALAGDLWALFERHGGTAITYDCLVTLSVAM